MNIIEKAKKRKLYFRDLLKTQVTYYLQIRGIISV